MPRSLSDLKAPSVGEFVSLDLKALSSGEFEGHGSVFRNIDLGGDVVVPGAFKRTLAEHGKAGTVPQMFWMHNPEKVPGLWTDMREDGKGLYVRGSLADTPLGNEMRTLLGMKAVRGLSIGYRATDVDYDGDGNRLLKEIDLWEVSIVSLAMNPLAAVEGAKSRLSSAGEYVPTEREFEDFLRDPAASSLRFSKNVRRFITAKVFGSSGGMPAPVSDPDFGHRWDAGEVDPDAAEVMKAIERLTEKQVTAAFAR